MKKNKLRYLKKIYKVDEDFRIASIVLNTILELVMFFLCVAALALYSGDNGLIGIMLAGAITFAVPIALLLSGHLRLSIFLFIIIVLFSLTLSAVMGQGIHDVAILVFPVVIFFANLFMQRKEFFWFFCLVLAVVVFLGLEELFGWFSIEKYANPIAVDIIFAILIIMVAVMVADSLSENNRRSMALAQKEISRRKKIQAQLRHLSIHDDLTGVYNRAFFEEVIALLERGREYPVSIIFVDIDDLKEVNDSHGHAAGDELIRCTAKLLSTIFRFGDIIARIGGDEFSVVLPRTSAVIAEKLGQRMRRKLSEYNAENPDSPIKISLGISTANKGDLKKTIEIADKRMYVNKAARKLK